MIERHCRRRIRKVKKMKRGRTATLEDSLKGNKKFIKNYISIDKSEMRLEIVRLIIFFGKWTINEYTRISSRLKLVPETLWNGRKTQATKRL